MQIFQRILTHYMAADQLARCDGRCDSSDFLWFYSHQTLTFPLFKLSTCLYHKTRKRSSKSCEKQASSVGQRGEFRWSNTTRARGDSNSDSDIIADHSHCQWEHVWEKRPGMLGDRFVFRSKFNVDASHGWRHLWNRPRRCDGNIESKWYSICS